MPGYRSAGVFFIFSLLYFSTIASAADTLYFKGKIKVAKSISYDYSLRFTITDKNQVTGYSLSDPGGPTETKTKITGTYDSVNSIMNFEEKSVLRSKVNLQKNFLCFVKASLKLKKTKLIEELSGKFIGIEPGKTGQCASGEIKLINTNMVKAFLKQKNNPADSADKATTQIKKDKTGKIPEGKKEPPIDKPVESPVSITTQAKKENMITISDEKGKEFSITGNKIQLSIWDNGEVDGDRISILLNDKYILEDYVVTFSAKTIEVTLSDKEIDTIRIVALNEGKMSPNTAAIKITSKFEEYPIITKANLNEIRTIYLRKKNFP